MKTGRWYECWVTLVRGTTRGPELQVRRAWCESPGTFWGEPATQQAAIDALNTVDPRTGRADWTHGLVCVRRPLGSRNLADEITTTVYKTDTVTAYEGANPKYDEDCAGRQAARAADEVARQALKPEDAKFPGLGMSLKEFAEKLGIANGLGPE